MCAGAAVTSGAPGRILDGMMESVDPQVLVVADQVRLVVRQDPAVPGRGHELGIDDVGETFEARGAAMARLFRLSSH